MAVRHCCPIIRVAGRRRATQCRLQQHVPRCWCRHHASRCATVDLISPRSHCLPPACAGVPQHHPERRCGADVPGDGQPPPRALPLHPDHQDRHAHGVPGAAAVLLSWGWAVSQERAIKQGGCAVTGLCRERHSCGSKWGGSCPIALVCCLHLAALRRCSASSPPASTHSHCVPPCPLRPACPQCKRAATQQLHDSKISFPLARKVLRPSSR